MHRNSLLAIAASLIQIIDGAHPNSRSRHNHGSSNRQRRSDRQNTQQYYLEPMTASNPHNSMTAANNVNAENYAHGGQTQMSNGYVNTAQTQQPGYNQGHPYSNVEYTNVAPASHVYPIFNNADYAQSHIQQPSDMTSSYYPYQQGSFAQSQPDAMWVRHFYVDSRTGEMIECPISRRTFSQIEPAHSGNPYPTLLSATGLRVPFDHMITKDGVTTVFGFRNRAGFYSILDTYYPAPSWSVNHNVYQNTGNDNGYIPAAIQYPQGVHQYQSQDVRNAESYFPETQNIALPESRSYPASGIDSLISEFVENPSSIDAGASGEDVASMIDTAGHQNNEDFVTEASVGNDLATNNETSQETDAISDDLYKVIANEIMNDSVEGIIDGKDTQDAQGIDAIQEILAANEEYDGEYSDSDEFEDAIESFGEKDVDAHIEPEAASNVEAVKELFNQDVPEIVDWKHPKEQSQSNDDLIAGEVSLNDEVVTESSNQANVGEISELVKISAQERDATSAILPDEDGNESMEWIAISPTVSDIDADDHSLEPLDPTFIPTEETKLESMWAHERAEVSKLLSELEDRENTAEMDANNIDIDGQEEQHSKAESTASKKKKANRKKKAKKNLSNDDNDILAAAMAQAEVERDLKKAVESPVTVADVQPFIDLYLNAVPKNSVSEHFTFHPNDLIYSRSALLDILFARLPDMPKVVKLFANGDVTPEALKAFYAALKMKPPLEVMDGSFFREKDYKTQLAQFHPLHRSLVQVAVLLTALFEREMLNISAIFSVIADEMTSFHNMFVTLLSQTFSPDHAAVLTMRVRIELNKAEKLCAEVQNMVNIMPLLHWLVIQHTMTRLSESGSKTIADITSSLMAREVDAMTMLVRLTNDIIHVKFVLDQFSEKKMSAQECLALIMTVQQDTSDDQLAV